MTGYVLSINTEYAPIMQPILIPHTTISVLAYRSSAEQLKLRKRSERHGRTETDLKRHMLGHCLLDIDALDILLHRLHGKKIIPFGRCPLRAPTSQRSPQTNPGINQTPTSTATTPIPNRTTNALENALNPTPTNSPSTLPRLTCRIVLAVETLWPVLPCFRIRGSFASIAHPVSVPTAESVL